MNQLTFEYCDSVSQEYHPDVDYSAVLSFLISQLEVTV